MLFFPWDLFYFYQCRYGLRAGSQRPVNCIIHGTCCTQRHLFWNFGADERRGVPAIWLFTGYPASSFGVSAPKADDSRPTVRTALSSSSKWPVHTRHELVNELFCKYRLHNLLNNLCAPNSQHVSGVKCVHRDCRYVFFFCSQPFTLFSWCIDLFSFHGKNVFNWNLKRVTHFLRRNANANNMHLRVCRTSDRNQMWALMSWNCPISCWVLMMRVIREVILYINRKFSSTTQCATILSFFHGTLGDFSFACDRELPMNCKHSAFSFSIPGKEFVQCSFVSFPEFMQCILQMSHLHGEERRQWDVSGCWQQEWKWNYDTSVWNVQPSEMKSWSRHCNQTYLHTIHQRSHNNGDAKICKSILILSQGSWHLDPESGHSDRTMSLLRSSGLSVGVAGNVTIFVESVLSNPVKWNV